VTRPVALWLQRQLHFPNWNEADIAKMPETHVGEWARREHVYIEPAYDTEVREAGVRALGSAIPGVVREQLNAVPLDQWKRDKDRFVYETWIAEGEGACRAVGAPGDVIWGPSTFGSRPSLSVPNVWLRMTTVFRPC
jgi:hypothetical protein